MVKTPRLQTDREPSFRQRKWIPILLLLFTALIYLPFTGKGFITDDFVHIHHVSQNSKLLTSPGPFGLYRPVVELSFFLNYQISGLHPFWYGFFNLILHLLVVFLLFKFIHLLFSDQIAAFWGTLSFILTLKAHSIALNWISGRTSLLMSVFALLTLITWVKWERSGSKIFLFSTYLVFPLAILSKENVLLLPLLIVFLPLESKTLKQRLIPSFTLLLSGVFIVFLRYKAGALMPVSSDSHYNFQVPLNIIVENIFNYFFRSLPPFILPVLFILLPLLLLFRVSKSRLKTTKFSITYLKNIGNTEYKLFRFAILWFLFFIIPVSPLKMRSELYLYLSGAGFCILGGFILARSITHFNSLNSKKTRKIVTISTMLLIVFAGTYIIIRNHRVSRVALFSQNLTESLPKQIRIRKINSFIYLIPQDEKTRFLLKESISGYFDSVVKTIYQRNDIHGRINYEGNFPRIRGKINVGITYKNNTIQYFTDETDKTGIQK